MKKIEQTLSELLRKKGIKCYVQYRYDMKREGYWCRDEYGWCFLGGDEETAKKTCEEANFKSGDLK